MERINMPIRSQIVLKALSLNISMPSGVLHVECRSHTKNLNPASRTKPSLIFWQMRSEHFTSSGRSVLIQQAKAEIKQRVVNTNQQLAKRHGLAASARNHGFIHYGEQSGRFRAVSGVNILTATGDGE